MRSDISASPNPRAIRRSSDCSGRVARAMIDVALLNICTNTPQFGCNPTRKRIHHEQPFMISRRQFLRFIAGVGALGASTATYGFGIEPVLRLRVARYNITPPQWPAGFQLKIAAIADL